MDQPHQALFADPRARSAWGWWLAAAWLLILCGGAAALSTTLARPAGNELAWDRALFAAANALTLTGLPQIPGDPADLLLSGQVITFLLMFAGTQLCLLPGTLAFNSLRCAPWTRRRVLAFTAGGHLLFLAIGWLALSFSRFSTWPALFSAASALGNCGMRLGDSASPPVQLLILTPLALLGIIGASVWIGLWRAVREKKSLDGSSATSMGCIAAWLLAGILLYYFLIPSGEGTQRLITSFLNIMNAKGALGWTAVHSWPRLGAWLLSPWMLLSGAAGGASGGLALTALLWIRRGLADTHPTELADPAVRPPSLAARLALLWLCATAAGVFGVFVLLLQLAPQVPADTALFTALAAVGNSAVSFDPLSLTGPPLLLLTVAMLASRLLTLFIFVRLARPSPPST